MSLTIRSPDIRSEFDKYLTQQKLCFSTGAELAYIHQSCCFVRTGAALRNSRGARTIHGPTIYIGFIFLSYL